MNAGLFAVVAWLLMMLVVWSGLYLAIRLGVRHAMREARSDLEARSDG